MVVPLWMEEDDATGTAFVMLSESGRSRQPTPTKGVDST